MNDTTLPTIQAELLCPQEFHRYSIDASTAGFPPGRYPEAFNVRVTNGAFGNGQPFRLFSRRPGQWYIYQQEFGCAQVKVFND